MYKIIYKGLEVMRTSNLDKSLSKLQQNTEYLIIGI